jgi:protocatechuate 3,4-dioxygenase beta subunit
MKRREFLVTISAASVAMMLRPSDAQAQDVEYLQALERAQRERPATLTSRARIAPAGEPGIPMVIHGRVFKSDGRTPAPGIIVFAYHTDRTGIYAPREQGPRSVPHRTRVVQRPRTYTSLSRDLACRGRTITESFSRAIR